MRFQLPFVLGAALLATASPVVKRDGSAVVAAVGNLVDKMTALNTTVTSYQGGILGTFDALKIEFQSVSLVHGLKDAISATQNSAKFSDAESLSVSSAILGFEPKIFSTLDNIVSKKPEFDTGLLGLSSLSFLVQHNLDQQKDLSAAFGSAVVEKLTPTFASVAPAINSQIAAAFDKAIITYS